MTPEEFAAKQLEDIKGQCSGICIRAREILFDGGNEVAVADPHCYEHGTYAALLHVLDDILTRHHRRPYEPLKDFMHFGQTEFPDQCDYCRRPYPCEDAQGVLNRISHLTKNFS